MELRDFPQNYDYICNTRHENKILKYPLHKTKQLGRITLYLEMKFFHKIPNDLKTMGPGGFPKGFSKGVPDKKSPIFNQRVFE